MLEGLLLILIIGFAAGEVARRLKLPPLVGMLVAGIFIGPHFYSLLPAVIMEYAGEIRLMALLVILFKAGLGLDRDKIFSRGDVALRLGILPPLLEAGVVAAAARFLLGWSWPVSWVLGWIICAASPAVVVPMMLKLKSQGLGVKKGIPDLILAGGTLSDVFAVTMFGLTMTLAANQMGGRPVLQLLNIPLHIILGLLFGGLAGLLLKYILRSTDLVEESIMSELILALSLAMVLLLGENFLPYSEFLAIMTMGFTILERDTVLARRLRREVDKIWQVAEIFLFVLIGAAVNLDVMASAGLMGLLIIGCGLILGRSLAMYLAAVGSGFSRREKGFLVIGQSAKATVQAAIGGIPLAAGMAQGEYILAISVLSILITAPLGAWGIDFFAGRWLEKGKIDPTRINVKEEYELLVALDGSSSARMALKEAGRIARQLDARLLVVNVRTGEAGLTNQEIKNELEKLRDIEHRLITPRDENPASKLLDLAREYEPDYIFMGTGRGQRDNYQQMGSVAAELLKRCPVPVTVIDESKTREGCSDEAGA
ncbi:cation:proton antiporter [Halarsenatibacter silvermanii]|uniref:NhaP-type Na+/H+ or K+/H+ antiporter n=1 Tax=Halarsenatibacter silvermanii TaxID=321763 RepID=A0A1G9KS89_9FIRM|nr:cation:proton antiporter [Halarsenatibacter silvermanii]SDL52561.1 NhaP-type Na+/H+ or K+/H+ antiporter [Halarsenatibacter silvermanii]